VIGAAVGAEAAGAETAGVLANTGLAAGTVANTANRAVDVKRDRFKGCNNITRGMRLRLNIMSIVY
jgi:hypothetical protein